MSENQRFEMGGHLRTIFGMRAENLVSARIFLTPPAISAAAFVAVSDWPLSLAPSAY